MTCRHCFRGPATRPRGLCRTCYKDPAVRACYQVTNPANVYAVNGSRRPEVPDFNGAGDPPCCPTAAIPGTPAKIEALAARVAARQSLWHPLDADVSLE